MYKTDYFPIPQAYNFGEFLVKIPGLDGSGKMGKSEGEGNAVFLVEEPKSIRKKIMKAVTDSGPTMPNQEKPAVIQNLFDLMAVVSSSDTVLHFDGLWNSCEIRYGDLKKQLAEDVIHFTEPIRERILDIYKDTDYLSKVTRNGAERARESAAKTIKDVREIIGIRKF